MASCALATAASVSLMVAITFASIDSGGPKASGAAAAITVSRASSAMDTTSMASGKPCSKSFASLISLSICISSCLAFCCDSCTSCLFFCFTCITWFFSWLMLAWTTLTRFCNALRAPTVFGATFFASMISRASFFWVSNIAFCWACIRSSTILRLSSVTSPPIMARTLSRACVASISARLIFSVTFSTLASASATESSAA
mmetsp:Transcript_21623/g.42242  ORF Transcript_21623/g.42242 Transcript_21623/m.42242 type:complete len:201 (-) Transcript_21623:666-1268(-)